jgi:hypothetical protein
LSPEKKESAPEEKKEYFIGVKYVVSVPTPV